MQSKSQKNMLKRKGFRIDPCGTPDSNFLSRAIRRIYFSLLFSVFQITVHEGMLNP